MSRTSAALWIAVALAVPCAAADAPATRPTVVIPGTLEPYEQTDLYARIGGYVSDVKVDIGDRVAVKNVLAVIEQPELEKELAEANATLVAKQKLHDAADAALQQTAKLLEVARRQVDRYKAELALQDATYKRQQELAAGKAITDQQLDDAKSKAEVAKADAAIAEAKVGSAEADVKGAEAAKAVAAAQADVAKAQVEKIETMKGYLQITAPYDGLVTRRAVNRGDLATATPSGRGGAMFTIQRVDKLRVRCDLPEGAAIGVAVGDTATVKFIGLAGATVEGKVARTSHSLDAQMRTMRVEIDLANEDGHYRPGMYVQVTFAPAAAAVPAK